MAGKLTSKVSADLECQHKAKVITDQCDRELFLQD